MISLSCFLPASLPPVSWRRRRTIQQETAPTFVLVCCSQRCLGSLRGTRSLRTFLPAAPLFWVNRFVKRGCVRSLFLEPTGHKKTVTTERQIRQGRCGDSRSRLLPVLPLWAVHPVQASSLRVLDTSPSARPAPGFAQRPMGDFSCVWIKWEAQISTHFLARHVSSPLVPQPARQFPAGLCQVHPAEFGLQVVCPYAPPSMDLMSCIQLLRRFPFSQQRPSRVSRPQLFQKHRDVRRRPRRWANLGLRDFDRAVRLLQFRHCFLNFL